MIRDRLMQETTYDAWYSCLNNLTICIKVESSFREKCVMGEILVSSWKLFANCSLKSKCAVCCCRSNKVIHFHLSLNRYCKCFIILHRWRKVFWICSRDLEIYSIKRSIEHCYHISDSFMIDTNIYTKIHYIVSKIN